MGVDHVTFLTTQLLLSEKKWLMIMPHALSQFASGYYIINQINVLGFQASINISDQVISVKILCRIRDAIFFLSS